MNKNIKDILGVLVAVALLALVFSALNYVSAFERSVDATSPSFSASGEGKVVAVPDVAEFTFRVLTEGGTDLASLQEENTNITNEAIDFVKENGVSEEDIKTTSYNISPRYTNYPCLGDGRACPPSEITGYSVEQAVKVKVRDLDNTGTLLAGVVENGANSVSRLTFTIDDPSELKAQAREQAFEEANKKARAMADSGNFKMGKLISVQESGSSLPPVYAYEDVRGYGGGAPSTEPGSQEVVVTVTLEYQIR